MISITAEIPEELFDEMAVLIASKPSMNADDFIASAIAVALMQNGVTNRSVTRAFVEANFRKG